MDYDHENPNIQSETAKVSLSQAKSSAITPEKLTALSKDNNWFVRVEVAKNSSTPVSVLKSLASDADFRVLCDGGDSNNPRQTSRR